jgi:UDP-N-acetylmuramoyl-L-alanyl-D-glutamate--2,6-diaminopimelate ligase
MNPLAITKKQYTAKHLRTLLDGLVDFEGTDFAEGQVSGLSLDSRLVKKGNLFLACAGSHSADKSKPVDHGMAYAGQAINFGASVIAWEPIDELDEMPVCCKLSKTECIPLIRIENLHEKLGLIAARYYQNPSENLTMIGVTGTNGKTSTAHIIVQILYLLNQKGWLSQRELLNKNDQSQINKTCALMGTLGNGIYPHLNDSTHTTPDALNVQKMLAEFRDEAINTVVMEVSSHALAQDRVSNILFDIVVFTNLSRDHLDYHGDMQNYAQEKLKLFQFPSVKKLILNIDDEFSTVISQSLNRPDSINASNHLIFRVSQQNPQAELYASKIELTHSGIKFELNYKQQKYLLKANLVGLFNVDNLLAATAVVISLGYDINEIVPVIENLLNVPGRMEIISNDCLTAANTQPLVVVDYAHTPDALEKALKSLRAHCSSIQGISNQSSSNQSCSDQDVSNQSTSRLICVFGCGGERDKGKRPLMAKVAERYADRIIVTTDNPRTEKIDEIIDDIVSGFKHKTNVEVIADRALAIESAIRGSIAGDVILVAGKGHEIYQEINTEKLPFSDKEIVRKVFCNMEKKKC